VPWDADSIRTARAPRRPARSRSLTPGRFCESGRNRADSHARCARGGRTPDAPRRQRRVLPGDRTLDLSPVSQRTLEHGFRRQRLVPVRRHVPRAPHDAVGALDRELGAPTPVRSVLPVGIVPEHREARRRRGTRREQDALAHVEAVGPRDLEAAARAEVADESGSLERLSLQRAAVGPFEERPALAQAHLALDGALVGQHARLEPHARDAAPATGQLREEVVRTGGAHAASESGTSSTFTPPTTRDSTL
jgi:hypothetical protein